MKHSDLSETVDLMVSPSYKQRFLAEYHQLCIRLSKLKNMCDSWDKGLLHFKPTCPRSIYDHQIKAMSDYKEVLETRATLENIEINA